MHEKPDGQGDIESSFDYTGVHNYNVWERSWQDKSLGVFGHKDGSEEEKRTWHSENCGNRFKLMATSNIERMVRAKLWLQSLD